MRYPRCVCITVAVIIVGCTNDPIVAHPSVLLQVSAVAGSDLSNGKVAPKPVVTPSKQLCAFANAETFWPIGTPYLTLPTLLHLLPLQGPVKFVMEMEI